MITFKDGPAAGKRLGTSLIVATTIADQKDAREFSSNWPSSKTMKTTRPHDGALS